MSKTGEENSALLSKCENGRPPYPLSTMLRVHSMQLFYNLSDPAMDDALYEIESVRQFAGLRLSERLPDETTILNFRHFLEQHKLGNKIFDTINQHLSDQGLMLHEGSHECAQAATYQAPPAACCWALKSEHDLITLNGFLPSENKDT